MWSVESPIWGIRKEWHNLTSCAQIQNSFVYSSTHKEINSTQTCCGVKLLSQIVFTKQKAILKQTKNSLSSLPTCQCNLHGIHSVVELSC